jgi:hypothetical protein
MKFQIGAMSVGDILDRGVKVLLARLPTFYVINLIVLTPLIAYQLALPALMQTGPTAEPNPAQLGAVVGGFLLLLFLTLILQPIGTAAILHVISQEFVDQRAGLGAALGVALRRFGKLLGASILAGLVIVMGFLLCIVPGIFFSIWYVFVAQVVVVEDLGGVRALARSKALTEGFRWRVLGLLLLFFAIGAVFQMAVGSLGLVLPSTERVPTGSGLGYTEVFVWHNYVINTLAGQLLGILVQTFQAVCMTLLYFDLRIRKEGFDLELASRIQAPTTT